MSEMWWSNHSDDSLSCNHSEADELSLEIDPDPDPRSPITPGCLGPLTDLFNFEKVVDRSSNSDREPTPGSSSLLNKRYSSSPSPFKGLSYSSSTSIHPKSAFSERF